MFFIRFRLLGLGSYLSKETASYLNEGLLIVYSIAADHGRVLAKIPHSGFCARRPEIFRISESFGVYQPFPLAHACYQW